MLKEKKIKLVRIILLVLLFGFSFIPFLNDELAPYRSVFGAFALMLNGMSIMLILGVILVVGYIGAIALSVLSFLGKYENKLISYFTLIPLGFMVYLILRNSVYSSGGYVLLEIILLIVFIGTAVFDYYVIKNVEKNKNC